MRCELESGYAACPNRAVLMLAANCPCERKRPLGSCQMHYDWMQRTGMECQKCKGDLAFTEPVRLKTSPTKKVYGQ